MPGQMIIVFGDDNHLDAVCYNDDAVREWLLIFLMAAQHQTVLLQQKG